MAAKPRVDVLIENGTVDTADPQRRVIRNVAVAIVKNREVKSIDEMEIVERIGRLAKGVLKRSKTPLYSPWKFI